MRTKTKQKKMKHKSGYIKGIAYCGVSARLNVITDDWNRACIVARTIKPKTVLRGNLLTGEIYKREGGGKAMRAISIALLLLLLVACGHHQSVDSTEWTGHGVDLVFQSGTYAVRVGLGSMQEGAYSQTEGIILFAPSDGSAAFQCILDGSSFACSEGGFFTQEGVPLALVQR